MLFTQELVIMANLLSLYSWPGRGGPCGCLLLPSLVLTVCGIQQVGTNELEMKTVPHSCRIHVNPDNEGVWFDHKEPKDESIGGEPRSPWKVTVGTTIAFQSCQLCYLLTQKPVPSVKVQFYISYLLLKCDFYWASSVKASFSISGGKRRHLLIWCERSLGRI